jgi:hypothetical protein
VGGAPCRWQERNQHNRSPEVVRTVLNRAARSYRDPDGRPWLEAMPPLITMLPENPRSPYPITWLEQGALFRRLPAHLARMAHFAVNIGLRDSNLCGLHDFSIRGELTTRQLRARFDSGSKRVRKNRLQRRRNDAERRIA